MTLNCFISNFKLKYEDSENIKADRVNTVVFNLHQIKRRAFFFFFGGGGDTRYIYLTYMPCFVNCTLDKIIKTNFTGCSSRGSQKSDIDFPVPA